MHVSNSISPKLLSHFFKMIADGAIMEEDVKKFLQDPTRWRKQFQSDLLAFGFILDTAQSFWQGVYDDLDVKVEVPPVPKLTEKQVKSINKFGFLLIFVPAITEEQYPESFVKPKWIQCFDHSKIERKSLDGKWIAIETIAKPAWNDPAGYPNDRLMAAIKRDRRFHTSHDDLTGGLLSEIAKVTGFPNKGTRLPSAEEWHFVGNLFNWLRENRSMFLPDLDSTSSFEWCSNACGSGSRRVEAGSGCGGHVGAIGDCHDGRCDSTAFRVVVDL